MRPTHLEQNLRVRNLARTYGSTGQSAYSQVVVLFGQRHLGSLLQFLVVLLYQFFVYVDLGWCKGRRGHKLEVGVADQFARQPQEWLLKIVVAFCADVVVLQVFLAVERNGLGLNLALFDINLIAAEHDGDVFAHTHEITMPIGDILVRDPRGYVKHNDGALALNVVTVAQATELLLSGRIPRIEADRSEVGVKRQWMDFDAKGRDVFLLKLASQVTLDKCRFARSTVTDEDELEGRRFLLRHFFLLGIR